MFTKPTMLDCRRPHRVDLEGDPAHGRGNRHTRHLDRAGPDKSHMRRNVQKRNGDIVHPIKLTSAMSVAY